MVSVASSKKEEKKEEEEGNGSEDRYSFVLPLSLIALFFQTLLLI
jgi:hypothetical protein